MTCKNLPDVKFQVSVRDDSLGGDNPYRWETKSTKDFFAGKKTILFSLLGSFTPTCSTYQLADFNKLYSEFQDADIEEIYCLSINDSFVMSTWTKIKVFIKLMLSLMVMVSLPENLYAG